MVSLCSVHCDCVASKVFIFTRDIIILQYRMFGVLCSDKIRIKITHIDILLYKYYRSSIVLNMFYYYNMNK